VELSDKAPKEQDPWVACRFCKQAGHQMKDYVEFLKWLHEKGIPFTEE
jgi:hypothetical protein